MHKLEVGDKYLNIHILGGQLKLVAFLNKDKKSDRSPDFRGDGIAVWVSEKKEPKEQPKKESPL